MMSRAIDLMFDIECINCDKATKGIPFNERMYEIAIRFTIVIYIQ